MIFRTLLPALAMLIFIAGCTTPQPKKPEPPDVSGVDVPALLLRHHEYIQPKDASNDGLFAAHHANKTAAKYADWQLDMIEQLMRLSGDSGKPIKIHGGAADVH